MSTHDSGCSFYWMERAAWTQLCFLISIEDGQSFTAVLNVKWLFFFCSLFKEISITCSLSHHIDKQHSIRHEAMVVHCIYSRVSATGACVFFFSFICLKPLHKMPRSWNESKQWCKQGGRGGWCAFRARCLLQPNDQAEHMMQRWGGMPCEKKQMRDIPETLQDKMGQRMRLTVNGLLSSPLQGYFFLQHCCP